MVSLGQTHAHEVTRTVPSTAHTLELSAMGGVRPPVAGALAAARRREAQGFDAIWWADHFLHWFPLSIWTPDLVPQAAAGQATPHVWFDPFAVIAAAASVTDTARLGVGVTDVVRRHPAVIAQTALTLDHVTGGRFVLGIGTGETLNIAPIGLRNDHAAGRLEEGIAVIRRLFDTHEPIDFAGEFFQLDGMSLGVRPVGDRPPPIWLAAHRPRMLALTGRTADGWMPVASDPAEYAAMLAQVHAGAVAAGRDPAAITPALYCRIVIADSAERARQAIDDSLLMRFIALTRSAEAFARRGAEHPLGHGAFGLTVMQPGQYDRAAALALAEAVPPDVVRDSVLFGTPDEIAAQLAGFVAVGVRHIQLTNMTPLADPALGPDSEALLEALVQRLRATA